jgi:hypothetical protein
MCGPFQLLTSLELERGGRALAAWFGMAGEGGAGEVQIQDSRIMPLARGHGHRLSLYLQVCVSRDRPSVHLSHLAVCL